MRAALLLLCVQLLLLNLGVMQFEIWSQIEYLHGGDLDPSSVGVLTHLPRYMVVAPAYVLADYFGSDANMIYGHYVLIVLAATSILWIRARSILAGQSAKPLLLMVLPQLLAPIINGRFAFGLFGLSVLLQLALLDQREGVTVRRLPLVLFALLFTSVSSGIFSVGLVFYWLASRRAIQSQSSKLRSSQSHLLMIKVARLIISLPLLGYFLLFLSKNVDFYGGGLGGLWAMISHGLGLLVNPQPLLEQCQSGESGRVCSFAGVLVESQVMWLAVALWAIALLVLLLLLLRSIRMPPLAHLGIGVALIGGVFGFTTLLSAMFVLPIAWPTKSVSRRRVPRLEAPARSGQLQLLKPGSN